MDAKLHSAIIGRLETSKSDGVIADYWVSWVGTAGRLGPFVRTWISVDTEVKTTHKRIVSLLDGLVCEQSIAVKVDGI